eukprot:g5000.t1
MADKAARRGRWSHRCLKDSHRGLQLRLHHWSRSSGGDSGSLRNAPPDGVRRRVGRRRGLRTVSCKCITWFDVF